MDINNYANTFANYFLGQSYYNPRSSDLKKKIDLNYAYPYIARASVPKMDMIFL